MNQQRQPQTNMNQSEYAVTDLNSLPKMRSGTRGEVLPAGRTLCTLDEIKGIRVTNNFTGEQEDKLDIKFKPVPIDGRVIDASINGWFTPTNSKKGNLHKLISEMSLTGTVDEGIRADAELFQATLMSYIGDTFLVAHEPSKSGKSNVINSVVPAPDKGPYKNNDERRAAIAKRLNPMLQTPADQDDIPFGN